MPASIAHMLISRAVRDKIPSSGNYKEFHDILVKHSRFMELGSLGPDLPYYENMGRAVICALLDKSDKPMGVDQWSYQLHSKDPNVFPLKMIEIAWREANEKLKYWEEDDQQKFAFICGFLTHIAADQIIHPIVNKIAGPYYKGGDHREMHRVCEVYQDIVIFNKRTGKSVLDEKLNEWCDINSGIGENVPVWFKYFIQKAFVEAHSIMPCEDAIEDWADGTLMTLRLLNDLGPYTKASEDFEKNKENSEKYKRFFSNEDYEKYFNEAINLSEIYIKATFKLYDADDLTDEDRGKFKTVVQNADLSSPLQKEIYNSANINFAKW